MVAGLTDGAAVPAEAARLEWPVPGVALGFDLGEVGGVGRAEVGPVVAKVVIHCSRA